MDTDSGDIVVKIVHSVTAQFDIADVKTKLFDFPRTAWKIIRTPSGQLNLKKYAQETLSQRPGRKRQRLPEPFDRA